MTATFAMWIVVLLIGLLIWLGILFAKDQRVRCEECGRRCLLKSDECWICSWCGSLIRR